MGRPRRPTGGRERGRGRPTPRGRDRSRDGTRERAPRLDAERVAGALASRGRRGTPATRLLRVLGGGRDELRTLRRLLRQLEREGRAERIPGGWRTPRADGLVEGVLVSARAGGGVVADDRGDEHRVDDAGDAREGDRVLVAPGRRGRAELLHVVDGARDRWVGILHKDGKRAGIAPYRDDGEWWIRVAREDALGAADGEVVAAVPVERRGKRARAPSPWARVVERLGRPGDPDADFAAVVWRHRLPVAFPPEALAEVDALRPPGAAEIAGRADLRDRAFVTIDPASARDHDDAVWVAREGDGHLLVVAIADVAHWVAPGSAIDREALRRGNSVYFPDRAIPMLPERLSGDLCSLRAGEDRLVMAVELRFDAAGAAGRSRCFPAVIRSRARLAYADAARAIEAGADDVAEAPRLRELGRLAERLRARRLAAGSLDLDLPTAVFRFDADGHPVDARPAPRNAAHRAIEEAMLAANRAVAERLERDGAEAVHRIHEPPAQRDREALVAELTALGLVDGGAPDALPVRELARALERAAGSPAERWIHQLALKSLRRARYSARSQPHYALGFEHYLHFTSPIRRYADLAVHRALKAQLAGEAPALRRSRAEAIAARVSFRERLAMAAEREMDQIKACVLLREHVGEVHDGTVSGLARHGVYVLLDAWWVEGLVHASRLPGGELEEGGRAWSGGGARYALGDRVRVAIAAADPVRGRVDFEPVGGRRPGPRRG